MCMYVNVSGWRIILFKENLIFKDGESERERDGDENLVLLAPYRLKAIIPKSQSLTLWPFSMSSSLSAVFPFPFFSLSLIS